MKKNIIIAGPTASGKSYVAFKIAEHLEIDIINADSRQFYKGLPILTAQPEIKYLQSVKHILYEEFPYNYYEMSAGKWLLILEKILDNNIINDTHSIITGGSGFYINALTDGIHNISNDLPADLLKEINDIKSTEELYTKLKDVDIESYQAIHPSDRYRISRALRAFYATGIKMSEWNKIKPSKPEYSFYKVLIMPDRDLLKKNIKNRFDAMMTIGLIDEIQSFIKLPNYEQSPLYKSCGLLAIKDYIDNKIGIDEAIERLITNTWQYARRQITWFKKRFEYDFLADNADDAIEHILNADLNADLKNLK